jgi:hypothetical protein
MGMNEAARAHNFPAPFLLRNQKVGLPSYNPSAAAAALGLRFESKSAELNWRILLRFSSGIFLCVRRVASPE